MKIKYTAKSEKAKKLFQKFIDVRDQRIEKLSLVKDKPYTVVVIPRFTFMEKRMIKAAMKRPELKPQIVAEMEKRYKHSMLKEGLKSSDCKIEVIE